MYMYIIVKGYLSIPTYTYNVYVYNGERVFEYSNIYDVNSKLQNNTMLMDICYRHACSTSSLIDRIC